MTLYDDLGVGKDASADEIKKAYRRKMSKAHPDRPDGTGSEEKAKSLNRAIAVLGDPNKRAHYDQMGEDDQGSPADPIRARAESQIMDAFDQTADRFEQSGQDPIEGIRMMIKQNQRVFREQIVSMEGNIKKLEKRRGRVIYKGGGRNFLLDLLDKRIAKLRADRTKQSELIEVGNHALQILDDFSWKPDEQPNGPGTYGFTFSFPRTRPFA